MWCSAPERERERERGERERERERERESFIHTEFRSYFICILFTELFREDILSFMRTNTGNGSLQYFSFQRRLHTKCCLVYCNSHLRKTLVAYEII